MQTKLTLTMDEGVIRSAKIFARQQGSSLSSLIENMLRMLIKEKDKQESGISPGMMELMGSFKAPEGFDYRKELSKALAKKHV